MTLAEYNERRKALARLERIGWLNFHLNRLMLVAQYGFVFDENVGIYDGVGVRAISIDRAWAYELTQVIRAYRTKHKFWECR